MTPERWQQVREVFGQVLELAPENRASFLDDACAKDHSLPSEVESLLSSDESVRSSFLQSHPIVHLALTKRTRLGDYEIALLLGLGAMGEVYRAIILNNGNVDPSTGIIAPTTMTVSQLWANYQQNQLMDLRGNSAVCYELVWRLYIQPRRGETRIAAVKTLDIEKWLSEVKLKKGQTSVQRVYGEGSQCD